MFAGLPDLEGSEKQVAWAVSIREKLLKSIETKLNEKRLIDFVEHNSEIASAIEQANQKRTSAQWWIDNRDITGDCLISVALLNLGLISSGSAFRVREVYREKTKQGDNWVVTREAENNNWVLPVFLKNNLSVKSAEKIFVVEQWGTNLERVGATTNPPATTGRRGDLAATCHAKTENLKIFSLADALDKSRNNNSGWPSRGIGLVVLKYSFSYPALAAPYMNCYGVSRQPKKS